MRLALPLLAVFGSLLVAACGRVDEPPTNASSVTVPPAPVPTAAKSAAAVSSAAPAAPNRCVRKSPAVASRTQPKGPDKRCPKDPEGNQKVRSGKVTFGDDKHSVATVEIVENDHDRQRGLMYRTKMADDAGMIFVFEAKENHAFWMHNTCIPLDMLYIDDDGFIVGIEESTPTMSDDTFQVGCPAKYVLEMNAGWSRAHGVVAGQTVKLDL